MGQYLSNYDIAQEISARIGTSPVPFDSVYSIAQAIYNELGGAGTDFDSVYSILLGILPLVESGAGADIQVVTELPDAATHAGHIYRLSSDSKIYVAVLGTSGWDWKEIPTDLSDYATIAYVDEQIATVTNTENADLEEKTTIDFTFVESLPASGEEDQYVIINGENQDTLYKYVSGAWVEQTPDANSLYFDTEGAQLYSYVTAEQQFAPVSTVNTIIVSGNLNSNAALKAIKTAGNYNVLQHLSNATRGSYLKNWAMTVQAVDYDEYDTGDSVYQKLENNVTIYKRTWSGSRSTNDGWTTFSTYYEGLVKDTATSKYYTWSSQKLNNEFASKQDILPENVTEFIGVVYKHLNTDKGLQEIPANIIGEDGNFNFNDNYGAYLIHKDDVLDDSSTIYDGTAWYYNAINVNILNYSKLIYRFKYDDEIRIYNVVRGLANEIKETPDVTTSRPLTNEVTNAFVDNMMQYDGKVICWNGVEQYVVGSNDVSHTPKIYIYTVEDDVYKTNAAGIFRGHTLLKKGHFYKIHCVRFNHYYENYLGSNAQFISGWVLTFDEIGDLLKTVEDTAASLDLKQDTLTAGDNITIDASNNISAANPIEEVSALPEASENKDKLVRLNSGDKKVYASKLESSVTVTTNRLPDAQQIDKAYLYEDAENIYYYKGAYTLVLSDGEVNGYGWLEDLGGGELFFFLTDDNAENVTQNSITYICAAYDDNATIDETNKIVTNPNYSINDKDTLQNYGETPIVAIYNAPEANQIGNATLYDTANGYNATYTGEQVTFIDTDGGNVEVTAYKWEVPDTTNFIATSKPASEIYYYLDDENFTFTDTIIWAVYSDSSERIGTAVRNLYIPQLNAPDSEQVDNAFLGNEDISESDGRYFYKGQIIGHFLDDSTLTLYAWYNEPGDMYLYTNTSAENYYGYGNKCVSQEDIFLYYDSETDTFVSGDYTATDALEIINNSQRQFSQDEIHTVKYQRTETTEEWGWQDIIPTYASDSDIDDLFAAPIVKRVLMKHPGLKVASDYYVLSEGLINENDETMEYNGSTYYVWRRGEDGYNPPTETYYNDSRVVVLTDTLDVDLPFTYQSPECKYVLLIDNNEEDNYPIHADTFDKEALEDENGNITYRT